MGARFLFISPQRQRYYRMEVDSIFGGNDRLLSLIKRGAMETQRDSTPEIGGVLDDRK